MTMRVAMLGWEFPPFISGGLGVHCFELTKALGEMGIQVDFYMPKSNPVPKSSHPNVRIIPVDYSSFEGEIDFADAEFGPYFKFLKLKAGETVEGGEAATDESYGLNFFEAVGRYNFLVAKLVQLKNKRAKYDLIHSHDWITAKAGMDASRRINKPLVFTFHSTEYDRTANLSPFDWIVAIEKEAAHRANHVIAVSNMTKNQVVQRFQISPDKVSVVYNGIDLSKYRASVKKEQFGINEKVVLFHGRLSIQKGPDFFLKAAAKVLQKEKNVKFIISGKGDMLPQLITEAINLGIIDKVMFTGYIEEEKLPYLYAIADAYVLPSVSEPFGLTVLEAMANGIPVIVSKSTGISEVVNHCLRVDFWDTNEMANKILAVLRYAELKEMLGNGGREEAKHFTWHKTAKETLGVYSSATKG
ncbi:MAG: glycosyltransferase family 4 protein [Candidatus Micrarchaeota archaeon]